MTSDKKSKIRRTEAPYSLVYLKQTLDYNPETGEWLWLTNHWKRRKGDKADMRCSSGYNDIKLGGVCCRASNVAWFYMTGEWPKTTVDHINRIRSDDRWANLRLATSSQQMINTVRKKKSGLPPGVCNHLGKYKVRVGNNYNSKHVGLYDTPEEAHKAYIKEQIRLGRKEFLPK